MKEIFFPAGEHENVHIFVSDDYKWGKPQEAGDIPLKE